MIRQLTLYTLRRFSLKAVPERVLLPEEFYIVETWQDFLSSHSIIMQLLHKFPIHGRLNYHYRYWVKFLIVLRNFDWTHC